MAGPLFSILHSSARPDKWRAIYDAWMNAARHPEDVEYVLCVDQRWGFDRYVPYNEPVMKAWGLRPGIDKVVWNPLRLCYVDGVNTAAEFSTGRILIVNADDQHPCENWDESLIGYLERLAGKAYGSDPARWPDGVFSRDGSLWPNEFVIQVSTGTPFEHERGIMVMPILSRARYKRLGYVFFPEYESAFADNDFYSEALRDDVIIRARDLIFPHDHPLAHPGAWDKRGDLKWISTDAVYAVQNRPEAYQIGMKIFARRWPKNQDVEIAVPSDFKAKKPGGIALALPGETFHHAWVAKLLEITATLLREGWNYCTLLQHTSEPGITRATIVKSITELMELGDFRPEFILWMDDDQIVEPQQVLMLLNDAKQFPDVDMFAGWTWIASSGPFANEPQVSCGRMDLTKGELSYAEHKSVQSANGVFEVGWTGFPLVLMRMSALAKVGKHPFSHYPCPESPWGECGEDISFCKRLGDAGGRIYVDSRVFVPHMKLKALGPVLASKEEIALALTGAAAAD